MLLRLAPQPPCKSTRLAAPGEEREAGSARGRSRGREDGSGRLEIDRAGLAAAVGLELVRNALVAIERAHAGLLDGGDVDERVGPAALGRDEAIALVGVEEFDGAGDH